MENKIRTVVENIYRSTGKTGFGLGGFKPPARTVQSIGLFG
jgi:hypothetical protein